tara:strand:- start:1917 stop:2372 length:456 start_codon:yes stop_codon:yes gene_type:complete
MFAIAPGAKTFKSEKIIPTGYECGHEVRTDSQKTIRLYHKRDQHGDALLDVIFPPPFSDNLYFGTVYFSINPPCSVEVFLRELERLDIQKNTPPTILSDVTLNSHNESEPDTSSDESEEPLVYETSEDGLESDDLSDDDSQCAADTFNTNE